MTAADHSWLWPGEQIVYWARQNLVAALRNAVLVGAGAAAATVAIALVFNDDSPTEIAVDVAIAAVQFGLFYLIAAYRRLELVLTSRRLFYRTGWFWRSEGELAVEDVTAIKGSKPGDHPFELKFSDGESLNVYGLPDLGRLRDTLARAAGTG